MLGRLALLAAGLATAATSVRCPEGCRCQAGARKGGACGVTAECKSLQAFPASDEYPEKLDCLFINSRKLSKLSPEAKEAGLRAIPSSVRRLDLAECGLGQLPEGDALGRLKKLRVLNLEFNKLTALPADAFHGLTKLKVLWLTGNHWQPNEDGYKRMKALGNRIERLDPLQFQGLKGLQVLLLHHNKLQGLPEGLFADTKRLKVIKLLDNPFTDLDAFMSSGVEASDAENSFVVEHPALLELLKHGKTYQLDLFNDSGDDLEDFWEENDAYLDDEFFRGPPNAADRRKEL